MNHLEKIDAFFRANPVYREIYNKEFCIEVVSKLFYGFLPEIRYKSPLYALKVLRQVKGRFGLQVALKNFGKISAHARVARKIKCFYWLCRMLGLVARV